MLGMEFRMNADTTSVHDDTGQDQPAPTTTEPAVERVQASIDRLREKRGINRPHAKHPRTPDPAEPSMRLQDSSRHHTMLKAEELSEKETTTSTQTPLDEVEANKQRYQAQERDRIISELNREQRSIGKAIGLAAKYANLCEPGDAHDDDENPFEATGAYQPGYRDRWALAFVRAALCSPFFERCRGDGSGLVSLLSKDSAGRAVIAWLGEHRLVVAGNRAKMLAGQSIVDRAIELAPSVKIPPVLQAEYAPTTWRVWRFMKALEEVSGGPGRTVFASHAKIAESIGRPNGGGGQITTAIRLLERLQLIEVVSRGSRRMNRATGEVGGGLASEYRLLA